MFDPQREGGFVRLSANSYLAEAATRTFRRRSHVSHSRRAISFRATTVTTPQRIVVVDCNDHGATPKQAARRPLWFSHSVVPERKLKSSRPEDPPRADQTDAPSDLSDRATIRPARSLVAPHVREKLAACRRSFGAWRSITHGALLILSSTTSEKWLDDHLGYGESSRPASTCVGAPHDYEMCSIARRLVELDRCRNRARFDHTAWALLQHRRALHRPYVEVDSIRRDWKPKASSLRAFRCSRSRRRLADIIATSLARPSRE